MRIHSLKLVGFTQAQAVKLPRPLTAPVGTVTYWDEPLTRSIALPSFPAVHVGAFTVVPFHPWPVASHAVVPLVSLNFSCMSKSEGAALAWLELPLEPPAFTA